MADEAKIQIAIEAINNAKKVLEDASKDTQKMADNTKSSLNSLKDNWIAYSAAVTGAFLLLQKAFGYAEIAAQFQEQKNILNTYAKAWGTTANEVLRQAKIASGGELSMADATETAVKMLDRISPKTMNELIIAAEKMSKIFGGDIKSVMEQFNNYTLAGVERGLTKTLKLNLDTESAIKRYAQAHKIAGNDVKELTENIGEQGAQAARTEALLEALRVKLGKVGDQAETTADQFDLFKAQMQDLKLLSGELIIRVGNFGVAVVNTVLAGIEQIVTITAKGLSKLVSMTQAVVNFLDPIKAFPDTKYKDSILSSAKTFLDKMSDGKLGVKFAQDAMKQFNTAFGSWDTSTTGMTSGGGATKKTGLSDEQKKAFEDATKKAKEEAIKQAELELKIEAEHLQTMVNSDKAMQDNIADLDKKANEKQQAEDEKLTRYKNTEEKARIFNSNVAYEEYVASLNAQYSEMLSIVNKFGFDSEATEKLNIEKSEQLQKYEIQSKIDNAKDLVERLKAINEMNTLNATTEQRNKIALEKEAEKEYQVWLSEQIGKGISDGLKEFTESIGSDYEQIKSLTKDLAGDMESTLSDLFSGTEVTFSSFINSIQRTLANFLSKQATQTFTDLLSGIFSKSSSLDEGFDLLSIFGSSVVPMASSNIVTPTVRTGISQSVSRTSPAIASASSISSGSSMASNTFILSLGENALTELINSREGKKAVRGIVRSEMGK